MKTRYQILKRVCILLNILATYLLGGGIYSASQGSGVYWMLQWGGMGLLLWISYELDYHVQEMLVKLYSKGE